MKSFLIICLDNLGDTVMALPAAQALKTLYPAARISIWVKEYAAGLFENQPLFAQIHASDPFWDTSPGRQKGGFKRYLDTLREIRAARYDIALILNTEWRRSVSALLAGIPTRIGYKRRSSQFFLTHAYRYKPGHIIDDHLRLVSAWTGKDTGNYFPELSVNKGNTKKQIAMHPFSGDPERKNWPIPLWRELIQNLARALPDYTVAVVGAKNDEPFMTQLKTNGRVELHIDRALPEIRTLLAESALFIGGDSGPGHIAAAVGTPVLSLFGSFNPDRCRPLGTGTTVVIKNDPLKDLPVKTVEAKVLEMLR